MPLNGWLIEFFAGSSIVDGKRVEPIEVIDIQRTYAPTRWARNHVRTLQVRYKHGDIGYSITGF